jgi:hypothetical protein
MEKKVIDELFSQLPEKLQNYWNHQVEIHSQKQTIKDIQIDHSSDYVKYSVYYSYGNASCLGVISSMICDGDSYIDISDCCLTSYNIEHLFNIINSETVDNTVVQEVETTAADEAQVEEVHAEAPMEEKEINGYLLSYVRNGLTADLDCLLEHSKVGTMVSCDMLHSMWDSYDFLIKGDTDNDYSDIEQKLLTIEENNAAYFENTPLVVYGVDPVDDLEE